MGELKHLSTPRRREDSPSSGERTGSSPNQPFTDGWGCRTNHKLAAADPKVLEGTTRDGESPVGEPPRAAVGILSTTNPGEFVGSRGDHPPRLNTFSDR